jgi:hypothetical protein
VGAKGVDLALTPTIGLVGGMTVQFAEGSPHSEIGEGLAISDEAFDLVEPLIGTSCPGWTPLHRYGVFELSPASRTALMTALRNEAERLGRKANEDAETMTFFMRLSDWLAARLDGPISVSILGY